MRALGRPGRAMGPGNQPRPDPTRTGTVQAGLCTGRDYRQLLVMAVGPDSDAVAGPGIWLLSGNVVWPRIPVHVSSTIRCVDLVSRGPAALYARRIWPSHKSAQGPWSAGPRRWAFSPSTTQNLLVEESIPVTDPGVQPRSTHRPNGHGPAHRPVNQHACCRSLPRRLCPGGTPGTRDVGGPFRGRPSAA